MLGHATDEPLGLSGITNTTLLERKVIVNEEPPETPCSHILHYRGNGQRQIEKRINKTDLRDFTSIYIYTNFAHYGHLYSLTKRYELAVQ